MCGIEWQMFGYVPVQGETNLRSTALTILALSLGASALNAQVPMQAMGNPLITEAKQAYASIKANLTAMAAKMPPEAYDFKATPDVRTFGGRGGPVGGPQVGACGWVVGGG